MKLDARYSTHPSDSKHYTTDHYLINEVFGKDEILFTYSHNDRIIAGGIMPIDKKVSLPVSKDLGVDYFLERREMGVINIGGPGAIIIDGETYELGNRDGIYIPKGCKDVVFTTTDKNNPAKFYINSAPAHKAFKIVKISIKDANPVHLGDHSTLNKRTIYQFVHPAVCESCQLVMGLTILEPNNVWNTMPAHTHERRMEVYFYFDMAEKTKVFHLMGEPSETRHIVVSNEQAVISPSWSLHSGVGTSNYTFIWGMCGENITFTDMDHIDMDNLR